jgi:hypothetical protein
MVHYLERRLGEKGDSKQRPLIATLESLSKDEEGELEDLTTQYEQLKGVRHFTIKQLGSS